MEIVEGLRSAEVRVKGAGSRDCVSRTVVVRTLCSCSRTARLGDDCPATLGIVSDRRRNEKTCKSRHGCSSPERNNDKESNGGWNQPHDEEPSGVEWRERKYGNSC
jgi:hypothetical protein